MRPPRDVGHREQIMQRTSTWHAAVWMLVLAIAPATRAEIQFAPRTLDDQTEIGYGLAIGHVDGDGHPADYRLLVRPLHGRDNGNGAGLPVRLMAYRIPLEAPEQASNQVVYEALHMAHNFDVEATGPEQPESLWVAGREGLASVAAQHADLVVAAPPSDGAGEVRTLRLSPSTRSLVAIEPMHGIQLVVYEQTAPGDWRRQVLDNTYNQGHAVAAGDLLGRGSDQVVAGWREPNADNRVGVRLYVPDDTATHWHRHVVDDNQTACEDLKLADLDGDGRLDIVAAGRATHNVIVYWNDCQQLQ
jgi:hypothetical protein